MNYWKSSILSLLHHFLYIVNDISMVIAQYFLSNLNLLNSSSPNSLELNIRNGTFTNTTNI